jgi:crotonobetainyl-CoA:carnitine CoA-transferase CaiB-like acyl-CoA transferase
MPGPLEGIRIVEFTQIIAAPFGGMLLSDMGAEVIKIEPLEGEPWRLHSQFIPEESKTYIGLNRGKKSLPLNLKNPLSTEIIARIIEKTDVVIINARPDVPEKLHIDYKTLSDLNPQIIYCDNTAFGRKGPDKNRPGYDIIVQAVSGLLAADNKVVDGVPQQITATAVADYSTGIAIAWAVCAALFARERNGNGQKIDTSLLNTALSIQGGFLELDDYTREPRLEFLENLNLLRKAEVPYNALLEEQMSLSGSTAGFRIYYNTYNTSDGVIAIGCLSESLRKKAAGVIGISDPRFEDNYDPNHQDSVQKAEELLSVSKRIIFDQTTKYWMNKFDKAGVPVGPVKFIQELMDDDQVLANDMLVEVNHSKVGKIRMVGPMVQMSETPLEVKSASPALGQHTKEVLSTIGYTDEDIDQFYSAGVVR